MLTTQQIQIRDPYVVSLDGMYYLYGTTDKDCWNGPGVGFDAYRSKDLFQWEGPFPVFRPPVGFWATENFWAPELHVYQGAYYLFASFHTPGRRRGTQILRAEQPLGPFVPWSDGPVTPRDWECLDGTLYVDAQGDPWMVFCHEWLQIQDGAMAAVRLSADLRAAKGEPVTLFTASQAPWNKQDAENHVTDGPFLYTSRSGKLMMLWSTNGYAGYTMGVAVSDGGILGPWRQSEKPLFDRDGGHGMIFTDQAGQLYLTLHAPNDTPNERPIFLKLEDTGDGLAVCQA